ncbi:hypothetical protein HpMS107_49760 [Helicobacter pylori]|jgi:hypothetical protein|uniref:Uncharacterized protein n=2 Tax=Cupriavidus metallidurans TaxID=119219 RepID=A0A482J266_9BURK|nr:MULTISPECIES: hypothetical protein [Cupriavidus]QBP14023.1 hypothetical protein DDF84_031340 [Cupriavidus metallidurans]
MALIIALGLSISMNTHADSLSENYDDLLDMASAIFKNHRVYGAEFYSQALPTGMKYGSWYQVSIEYQNTGTLPWEPGMVRLVNATGGDFGVNDVPLKYKVGAGGVASFSFNVKIECRSYLSFPFFSCADR